jgi:RNA polymerase sigma factor (sigma-70 family)
MQNLDIDVLYNAAIRGDGAAEDLLFTCLTARFRLFVRRRLWGQADWEDVVQEALATVSSEYRDIQISTSFAAWAYKVLRNKMLNYGQSRRRQAERTAPFVEANHASVPWQYSDIRRRLLDCLRRVGGANLRYARILNFHYLGYTTKEICERMNVRRENFYSILSRARVMLERCLEQEDTQT